MGRTPTRSTARSLARGAAAGLVGLEGGDFNLAPAAGTHHLVASLRGKWGAGFARVRHRVLNCRMPACLESGRQASGSKKKKKGEILAEIFFSFPEFARRALRLGRPSGAPARVILNVASRTAPACATEDVAGGGRGAVVNGFSFFSGNFGKEKGLQPRLRLQLSSWSVGAHVRLSIYLVWF